jgi:hypothetical protein
MTEVDLFLASTMPRLTEEGIALHNGDAGPRMAMWSRNAPVTLFGAAATKSGWGEIGPTFDWLASRFSNCESFTYEVIAAGASGDLGYIVGMEHTTVGIDGVPPQPYTLRGHDHLPARGRRVASGPPPRRSGARQHPGARRAQPPQR